LFIVVPKHYLGLDPLIVEVLRSHTDTPHLVGFLRMRDELVTDTSKDVTVWFHYCDIHVFIDSSVTTYFILPLSV
jgi:hypothetical protein